MKELNYNKLKLGVTVLDDDYIVYKKLNKAIAQLVLVKGTRVMKSRNGMEKLRANQAHVLLIVPCFFNYTHPLQYDYLVENSSINVRYGSATLQVYTMGKDIKPNGFNTNINNGCGKGIHFFCTLKQAENY